jgi:hypothetical protein
MSLSALPAAVPRVTPAAVTKKVAALPAASPLVLPRA